MIDGIKLIDCKSLLEKIRQTLSVQEAKVIILMRDVPYGTIEIIMEDGKVVHKRRIESVKD